MSLHFSVKEFFRRWRVFVSTFNKINAWLYLKTRNAFFLEKCIHIVHTYLVIIKIFLSGPINKVLLTIQFTSNIYSYTFLWQKWNKKYGKVTCYNSLKIPFWYYYHFCMYCSMLPISLFMKFWKHKRASLNDQRVLW